MKEKTFLQTIGIIFSIVAVLHALRLVLGWEVNLGDVAIPTWASVIGVVPAGYLAYHAFKFAK